MGPMCPRGQRAKLNVPVQSKGLGRRLSSTHSLLRLCGTVLLLGLVPLTGAQTSSPTRTPTRAPTRAPSVAPTTAPTQLPTQQPTQRPTQRPTRAPTKSPTTAPNLYIWHRDVYKVGGNEVARHPSGRFNLTLTSRRKVVEGAYRIRLNFTVNENRTNGGDVGHWQLNTSCIPYHAPANFIRQQIRAVLLKFHTKWTSEPFEPRVAVERRGNASAYFKFGYSYQISNYSGFGLAATNVTLDILGVGSACGCEDLLTYAEWSDGTQWNWGKPPGASNYVEIFQGSGLVALTKSVNISGLWMEGGTLVLGTTDCGEGWTPTVDTWRNKCFRAFNGASAWADAESNCRSLAPQQRGHLARIESEHENNLVRGLCRANVGDSSCWIGLRGGGDREAWGWTEESTMLNTTFRSWDWREPNSRKHVDGFENCTLLLSSYRDPFLQSRTVWNDDACSAIRPYVCEKRGLTSRYTLTIGQGLVWRGGSIVGPGNVTAAGVSKIMGDVAQVTLSESAYLVNNGALNLTAPLLHGQSASLVNNKRMSIGNESTTLISDTTAWSGGFAPILHNSLGATLIVDTMAAYEASIEWVFQSRGTVRVKTGELDLRGSGYAFQGSFSVPSPHTIAVGGPWSFQMMQPGTQLLAVTADHPIVGVNRRYGASESAGMGAYRLKYRSGVTSCVPYHATAEELQAALNQLSTIQAVGNVTVFRTGRPLDATWGYGYRHHIVFDKLAAYNSSVGATVSLYCAGSTGGCGCFDPTAAFVLNGDHRYSCASTKLQNSSALDPERCTMRPSVTITSLDSGGELKVTGSGTLYTYSGTHLLPSTLAVNFTEVRGGLALTSSKSFNAQTVSLRNGGELFLTGTGFSGIDVARTLYSTDQTANGRDTPSLLQRPPLVYATTKALRIYNGTLAVASLLTDFSSQFLLWQGGRISGRFNLRVLKRVVLNATSTVELRNGARLVNAGSFWWASGNMSLAEGAMVQNLGNITASAKGQHMHVLQDAQHSRWEPARCWSDAGWYPNPLCGGSACLLPPAFENLLSKARLRLVGNTTLSLAVPLNQRGRVEVRDNSTLVLAGGGTHNGTLDLDLDARLNLTAGSFNMTSTSVLRGAGSLVVLDGHHQLPATVGTQLQVVSGTAVADAPRPRFLGNVSVAGGLLHFTRLMSNGTSRGNFSVSSGTVLFRDVHSLYRDRGLINDRSSLRVQGAMYWSGGVMSGNAVVQCHNILDIDGGEKRIGGGLQVVYYDTAYWGNGDIVAMEEATLLHKGILQLKRPLTFSGRLAYEKPEAEENRGYARGLLQWED